MEFRPEDMEFIRGMLCAILGVCILGIVMICCGIDTVIKKVEQIRWNLDND